jgi:endoglucanase
VDAKTNKVVYRITTTPPVYDPYSEQELQHIDFTGFTDSGRFYLQGEGMRSFDFNIAHDTYRQVLRLLLRSYYLQRCGVALYDAENGLHHQACHLDDGQVAHDDPINKKGTRIDATGGWHDAGDYGKYICTTAVVVGRLLSLFEQDSSMAADSWLDTPEAENGIPDVIDEARVGLDWLLTMQRSDGAVYRKLSGAQWPPIVSPNEDSQPRYLYGPASSDTAKFTAAMAMAARVFQPYDNKLAQRYLKASLKSWHHLEQIPSQKVDWVEGDDSGSGKYLYSKVDNEHILTHDIDDRFWAAAELFITTGEATYENYLLTHISELTYYLFEWKDPSPLGMLDYLFHLGKQGNPMLIDTIHELVLKRAEELQQNVDSGGYRIGNHRFVWGFNKMVAEDGITLLYASRIFNNSKFLVSAQGHVDFLLGCNPFNQSFVTGVGEKRVRHVHHIFSRAVKRDVPGLLVGGPNEKAQAGIAPKNKGLLSYADNELSYATNEYAIDYNSSLIALLALIEQFDEE